VVERIEAVPSEKDAWVTVGDDAYLYKNFGSLANRPTISGTQFYADVEFWKQTGDPDYEKITNREAHITFSDNPSLTKPLTLVRNNSFVVTFECSDFIKQHVQFALSTHPLDKACVKQVDKVEYPKATFYLYKVSD
jgi:hypothetical protein